jgi:hypothetical protein
MRHLIVLATGLAVLGFSVPVVTAAHAEETVVIKRDHDRDWRRDWHRERGWRGEIGDRRIIIERHRDRGWHRGWYHDRD